jgi:hypothetical protein
VFNSPNLPKRGFPPLVHGGGQQELERLLGFGGMGAKEGGEGLGVGERVISGVHHGTSAHKRQLSRARRKLPGEHYSHAADKPSAACLTRGMISPLPNHSLLILDAPHFAPPMLPASTGQ